jgi:tetratricopeptide (TPR) repeat protein
VKFCKALVCVMMVCAAARAQEKDKDAILDEVRQHVAAAKVHYDLGEYREAADEYILVYRLKPIPAVLFNIAQAYRQGGLYDKAKQFYKSYLRESPNAANRATIEQSIREMDELLAKEKRTKEAPPSGVKEPPEATLPLKSQPPAKVADAAKPLPAKDGPKPPDVAKPAETPKPIEASKQPPKPAETPKAMEAWKQPPKQAEPSRATETPASKPPGIQVAMTTPRPPAPSAATSTQTAPAPSAESGDAFYTKWWFWTAVGVVAVGAGAAAMTMGGNAPPPSHFGTTGI